MFILFRSKSDIRSSVFNNNNFVSEHVFRIERSLAQQSMLAAVLTLETFFYRMDGTSLLSVY